MIGHRQIALFWPATLAALLTLGGCWSSSASESTSAPAGPPTLSTLNTSLAQPWAMAFLPDGRMLVTEKAGSLKRLSADGRRIEASIQGLPPVMADGQGALMDVVLSPDFAQDGWIYLSYSEPGEGAEAGLAGTAVARLRLPGPTGPASAFGGDTVRDWQVIYRQVPKVAGSGHFGSRLAFGRDGLLFISLGERQLGAPAQQLDNSLGKVVRIHPDGRIPGDNPVQQTTAGGNQGTPRPELWSHGHRNPQGLAIHPDTGALWLTEHGPQGGDELNRVQPGGNHGWPLRSYGCPYGSPVGEACRIGGGRHAPDFVEPVATWVPRSTAPSGLLFYTGSGFPEWQGHVFIGALGGSTLWRLVLKDGQELSRDEPLGKVGERIRCVRQGPDGWIYLLTDSGKLMKLAR